MLKIKNIKTLEGKTVDLSIESAQEFNLDAEGALTQLPALIDPEARFTSDQAEATLTAGITTLLIAPQESAPLSTFAMMQEKKEKIAAELAKRHAPLRAFFYLGDEISDADEIGKAKKELIAVWVDAVNLLKNEETQSHLDRIFQVAAQDALVIAVRLGNQERKQRLHSMERLLQLTEKYNTEIAFMDLIHREELDPVREAKKEELMVYGATSLNRETEIERDLLWEAVKEGTIEMLSSRGITPSLMLPLLLSSCHERKISLENIVACTRRNIEEIFHLKQNSDLVLVNLDKEQTIHEGPWRGKSLRGWPLYTIVNGEIFRNRYFST